MLDKYKDLLWNLLPKGRFWEYTKETFISKIVTVMAKHLVEVEEKKNELINGIDPRGTTREGILNRWMDCLEINYLKEKNDDLIAKKCHSKLLAQGGQSISYFEELIKSLGYNGKITEYHPFVAGSRCGERLTNDPWQFAWKVSIPNGGFYKYFLAGKSRAGDRLRLIENAVLINTLEELKPAHTTIIFEEDKNGTDL